MQVGVAPVDDGLLHQIFTAGREAVASKNRRPDPGLHLGDPVPIDYLGVALIVGDRRLLVSPAGNARGKTSRAPDGLTDDQWIHRVRVDHDPDGLPGRAVRIGE